MLLNPYIHLLKPHLLNTFDDTFTEAIQQLTQWGGVIMAEDLQWVSCYLIWQ